MQRLEGLPGGECHEQESSERKNKQIQTNHDMLQEIMYQLFHDGIAR